MDVSDVIERLHADARAADELHQRSRTLLVDAVRGGAAAGLSQRNIASAIGRSQPEVSRLLRFHGVSPLGRTLVRDRKRILACAATYGVRNVRVFGSVAHGTERPDSDIDLLVDLPEGMSLFALARLENDLSDLVGTQIDVVPSGTLRAHLADRVLAEAVPL